MVERVDSLLASLLEKARTTEAQPKEDFARFLDQALGGPGQPSSAETISGPTSLGTVGELIVLAGQDEAGQVEQTLGLLDRLAATLTQPETNLKQMEPLFAALDRQAESLLAAAENLPAEDQGRRLMEETAVTAKIQVAKFERGELI